MVGVPDAERGEDVAAAVVLARGRAPRAPTRCARGCKRELAAYKVPRLRLLRGAGQLPFTDTGKIDKRRLRALLAASSS